MIPIKYRLSLSSKSSFRGRKLGFDWGLIILGPSTSLSWAITVSKKASPLAVDRNRLRRQLNHFLYRSRLQLSPKHSFRIIINRPFSSVEAILSNLCSSLSIES